MASSVQLHWNGNYIQTKIHLVSIGDDGVETRQAIICDQITIHLNSTGTSSITLDLYGQAVVLPLMVETDLRLAVEVDSEAVAKLRELLVDVDLLIPESHPRAFEP